MTVDPIDAFLASQRPAASSEPETPAADLFAGSEPVLAAATPPASEPAPDVPAASVPAIVGDVANTSVEAALAELIRRVQGIEAFLRRNGADL